MKSEKLKKFLPYLVLVLLIAWHSVLFAQQRFPRPEFESGYTYPTNQLPNQRGPMWEYFDVAVLLISLSVTSWLALKKRSRQGLICTVSVDLVPLALTAALLVLEI